MTVTALACLVDQRFLENQLPARITMVEGAVQKVRETSNLITSAEPAKFLSDGLSPSGTCGRRRIFRSDRECQIHAAPPWRR